MDKRTIIMLSAKRSGSSAIFKIFQKHPDVGVCHINQEINYWEPNFWNLAVEAISGNSQPFIDRFINKNKSHPFLKLPEIFTEETVFDLWEQILSKLGPIVFDKSPQYIGNDKALGLIKKYIDQGNDVRIFGIIRDPKDTITSQYELWNKYVENDSPEKREQIWLEQYANLEKFQEDLGYFPIYRYEDFCQAPAVYIRQLLLYCGLKDIPDCYSHIKAINVGRYYRSTNKNIRTWKFSNEFIKFNNKYGYMTKEADDKIGFREYFKFFYKRIANKISPYRVN